VRQLILLAIVALATSCVQTTQSAFDKGVRAYNNGDYDQAYSHTMTSAESGDPRAQYNLGVMYRKGHGTPQNYTEALKWYCRAAVGGTYAGLSNIGEMYAEGLALPLDQDKAQQWHRMAAVLGDPLGQVAMVRDLWGEELLPKDREEVYLWLNVLFLQDISFLGYDQGLAQYIDDLEAQMTPKQIQAGKAAVKAWKHVPFDTQVGWITSSDACRETLMSVQ